MYLNAAVVVDESAFAEPVHEVAHPGSRCADHLGECFLAYLENYGFWFGLLPESRQQQQYPGQPPFTGTEYLIYKLLLDQCDAKDQMGDKELCERGVPMNHADDICPLDPGDA